MKNKILKVCLISSILVFAFAFSVSALGDFGDVSGYDSTGDKFYNSNYDGNELLSSFETSFTISDQGYYTVVLFTVNYNKLSYTLRSSEQFVNGDMTAVDFINFWSIDSIQFYYDNSNFLTNIDYTVRIINATGQLVRASQLNSDYVQQIRTLEAEIVALQSQIDELTTQLNQANTDKSSLQAQIDSLNDEILSNEETIERIQSDLVSQRELTQYWQDLYNSENESKEILQNNYDNLLRNYNSLNNSYDELSIENEALESRIDELQSIIDRGTYDDGFTDGYNQSLNDYETFKSGFVTVLSAPMYVLNSIFGFEIFGFNFFTVIQFILSLVLIIWLFKKMR